MAGLYPDVPSRRMAHDADGTVSGYYTNTTYTTPIEYAQAVRTGVNEDVESYTVPDFNQYGHWFIFPELREVDGSFIWANSGDTRPLETSGDTTNGIDGTWTQRLADATAYASATFDRTKHRTDIDSLAVSNVRGVRIKGPTGDFPGNQDYLHHFHVYGEISPGETPDRLLFIDEVTGLEFTAPIDYAEVPRGSSEDKEFRIKNNSASLTANTIQYTAESLSESSGGWYTYTTPGGATYSATQSVASLAAGVTTGIITMRRITPGGESVGLHVARTYLNVGSWS